MLTFFADIMATAGIAHAGLAAYVAWRRNVRMGWSLAVLLLAVAWWGVAYAVELAVDDVALKSRWGDLKYLGVAMLPPAWLTFVLQYTGRDRWVTGRLLCLLAVVPVSTNVMLALPATHDLVRSYPPSAAVDRLRRWWRDPPSTCCSAYNYLVLLVATVLFVASMGRLARSYRRMAAVLRRRRPGPVGGQRPVQRERGLVRHGRPDALRIHRHRRGAGLGALRRAARGPHPAGTQRRAREDVGRGLRHRPLRPHRRRQPGRGAADGDQPRCAARATIADDRPAGGADTALDEVSLPGGDADAGSRTFDVSHERLVDGSGRPAGTVVVLHEITERVRDRRRLQRGPRGPVAGRGGTAGEHGAADASRHRRGIELASQYRPRRRRSGGGWRLPRRIRPGRGTRGASCSAT